MATTIPEGTYVGQYGYTILKKNMSVENEKAYIAALNFALDTGQAILEAGGSSLDAVVATIMTMEDNPFERYDSDLVSRLVSK